MDPLLKGFIGLTSWLLYKEFRILCHLPILIELHF
jgi:hypothetical protein